MATQFPMIVVNTTIPIALQMNPNPYDIDIDASKVISRTQTIGGWVYEFWGERPSTIRVRGRTRPILDDQSLLSGNGEASVEFALFQLQQIYRLDKRQILGLVPILKQSTIFGGSGIVNAITSGNVSSQQLTQLSSTYIYYRYDVYQGFFTRFHWSQSAEKNPRWYEYDFEFLATTTAQNMLADAMFTPQSSGSALNGILPAVGAAAFAASNAPALLGTIKGLVVNQVR